jgi:hypothetical protein
MSLGEHTGTAVMAFRRRFAGDVAFTYQGSALKVSRLEAAP